MGNVEIVADAADLPDDGNECTTDTCNGMTPTFTPNTGSTCGNGGRLTCDAAGICGGCTADTDCPDDTFCSDWSCNASSLCERVIRAENTPLTDGVEGQVEGNCVELQCNAEGGVKTVNADTDFIDDGNECTFELCDQGVLQEGDEQAGEACTDGGTICDGSGNCVSCTTNADCNAQDTFCMDFSCDAGTCVGAVVTANVGQALPNGQQDGNCQVLQCAANGMPENVADNGDVPDDTNLNDCEIPTCAAGQPATQDKAEGETCSDGGVVCRADGACVACLSGDTRCDSQDTQCQDFSCGAGNTCVGTPAASGATCTVGGIVCDGAGSCVGCVGDAQCPTDTDCADHSCNLTTNQCQVLNAPNTTSCNDDGGTICNGSGSCVQCNTNADCNDNNECTADSCNAGVCANTNVAAGYAALGANRRRLPSGRSATAAAARRPRRTTATCLRALAIARSVPAPQASRARPRWPQARPATTTAARSAIQPAPACNATWPPTAAPTPSARPGRATRGLARRASHRPAHPTRTTPWVTAASTSATRWATSSARTKTSMCRSMVSTARATSARRACRATHPRRRAAPATTRAAPSATARGFASNAT
jgi:hypothetical protein